MSRDISEDISSQLKTERFKLKRVSATIPEDQMKYVDVMDTALKKLEFKLDTILKIEKKEKRSAKLKKLSKQVGFFSENLAKLYNGRKDLIEGDEGDLATHSSLILK